MKPTASPAPVTLLPPVLLLIAAALCHCIYRMPADVGLWKQRLLGGVSTTVLMD